MSLPIVTKPRPVFEAGNDEEEWYAGYLSEKVRTSPDEERKAWEQLAGTQLTPEQEEAVWEKVKLFCSSDQIEPGMDLEEVENIVENTKLTIPFNVRIGQATGFEGIEDYLARKRLKWFEEQKFKWPERDGSISALLGVPVLYTNYMGIDPNNYDRFMQFDDSHCNIYLEMLSRNFCPYLHACGILNLDTRIICPTVLEKPIESVVRRYASNARFFRGKLRPFYPYCEETVFVNPSREEYLEAREEFERKNS